MEQKSIKAIFFDLNTKEMEKVMKSVTYGYEKLKQSFKKNGFSHRQGSGYISDDKLFNIDVYEAIEKIAKENQWLCSCVNKIDMMNVTKKFEITPFVQSLKEKFNNMSQEEIEELRVEALKDSLQVKTDQTIESLQRDVTNKENANEQNYNRDENERF